MEIFISLFAYTISHLPCKFDDEIQPVGGDQAYIYAAGHQSVVLLYGAILRYRFIHSPDPYAFRPFYKCTPLLRLHDDYWAADEGS